MSKSNYAIVTLAKGAHHANLFESICRQNWQEYCDKNDFDLICIKEELNSSGRARKRSPAWQKLLVLSQQWSNNYSQVAWLDADIIINLASARNIFSAVPLEKVGAVDAYSSLTRRNAEIAFQRLTTHWKRNGVNSFDELNAESYYTARGIPGNGYNSVVQTGVLVCSPHHHKQLFEHTYNAYEDDHGPDWNYEMPALSFELLKNDCVSWIEPEYNLCVAVALAAFYEEALLQVNPRTRIERLFSRISGSSKKAFYQHMNAINKIYELSYFTHFAGYAHMMPAFSAFRRRGK